MWSVYIIFSFFTAIFMGKIDDLNLAIFSSAKSAVETTVSFLGTMCMWNGFIKIVQSTSLNEKINNLLKPLMRFLFPKLKKEEKEYSQITMNISANMLGIGNAATPSRNKSNGGTTEKEQ